MATLPPKRVALSTFVRGFDEAYSRLTAAISAQRPVHVPLYALNQPGYFFIFGVSDRRDLDRLAELNVRFPMRSSTAR